MAYIKTQLGRTMVEMLMVLALIGILSVGGAAGLRFGFALANAWTVQQQVTDLSKSVESLYAWETDYRNISMSGKRGICENIRINGKACEYETFSYASPWGGRIEVKPGSTEASYRIVYEKVPQLVCNQLLDMRWKSVQMMPNSCDSAEQTVVFSAEKTDGSCGSPCPGNQVCQNGSCVCANGGIGESCVVQDRCPTMDCTGVCYTGECVNNRCIQKANGSPCPMGTCRFGECEPEATEPPLPCDGACTECQTCNIGSNICETVPDATPCANGTKVCYGGQCLVNDCANGAFPGTGADAGKCCLTGTSGTKTCCATGQTPYCSKYDASGKCTQLSCKTGDCTQQSFPIYGLPGVGAGNGACCAANQTPYCYKYNADGTCNQASCMSGECIPQTFPGAPGSATCCPVGQTPYCSNYDVNGICSSSTCKAGDCTQQSFPVADGYGACCAADETAYCYYYKPNGICSQPRCQAGQCVPPSFSGSGGAGICCETGKTAYCSEFYLDGTCQKSLCAANECTPFQFDNLGICCSADQTAYCSLYDSNGKCISARCVAGICQPDKIGNFGTCCLLNQTAYCSSYHTDGACRSTDCQSGVCTQGKVETLGVCCAAGKNPYCVQSISGSCILAGCK